MNRRTALLAASDQHASSALPAIPSREYVCGVRTHFQGIVYDTTEFGRMLGFAPELLTDGDRPRAYAAHLAAGDRHVTMNLTGAYREADLLYPARLQQGHDWTADLAGLKARIREAICAGLCVDLALGGDGRSKPKNPDGSYPYNDPVGDTYGYEWLMDHLDGIIRALQDGEDLTPWILFRPGYDGVFYGWGDPPGEPDRQPQRVIDFGARFRSLLPNGYLFLEHTPGTLPLGEGAYDWTPGPDDPAMGRERYGMRHFDTIGAEFCNWPQRDDTIWQVAGRMLANYSRPDEQPAWDDPHPPFILGAGTPRGPWYPVAYEYAKYPESHGIYGTDLDVIVDTVNTARAYYRARGYQYWG